MPTSMHALAEIVQRHRARLDDSAADTVVCESLPVEIREQMLEEALASEDVIDVPRTTPYASGSRIPTNIAAREYRLTSAPEEPVQIQAIKLIDHVEAQSVVYRYRVDGFHAWLKLLKALFVRTPLDFSVKQDVEPIRKAS